MSQSIPRRPCTLEEILQRCREHELTVDMRDMTKTEKKYITICDGHATVHYSPVTGNFIGTLPNGRRFSAHDASHEEQHWFQCLKLFFSVEIV